MTNAYMFRHPGAVFMESSRTNQYKSTMLN